MDDDAAEEDGANVGPEAFDFASMTLPCLYLSAGAKLDARAAAEAAVEGAGMEEPGLAP
jgi:hypothetical protein